MAARHAYARTVSWYPEDTFAGFGDAAISSEQKTGLLVDEYHSDVHFCTFNQREMNAIEHLLFGYKEPPKDDWLITLDFITQEPCACERGREQKAIYDPGGLVGRRY